MAWYTIDKRLVTIKGFYFLTLGGIATLMPYLPIFLTQLGIAPSELSIIYSLIFFTTFVKNIAVGYVADKYQKHKAILVLSCIITGPLYCVLVAVPPIPTPPHTSTSEIHCAAMTPPNSNMTTTFLCDSNITVSCSERLDCLASNKCSIDCAATQEYKVGSSSSSESDSLPVGQHQMGSAINASLNVSHQEFNGLQCIWRPDMCTLPDPAIATRLPQPLFTSKTFWLCLVIVLLAALCGSNELMLNDAICISILGEDRSNWGASRLWGSAGYAISAFLVSVLIDGLASGDADPAAGIDYRPAFYVYLVLSLLSAVVAFFHPSKENHTVRSRQQVTGLKTILCNYKVILFLLLILVLGILNGVFITFGYLSLRVKFQASQLTIGLCVLVTVLVEMPTLLIGGKIVEQIGAKICLYLAFAAYSIRFLSYAYIPNQWWALMVEVTHLFTFALMFTAAMMHASQISTSTTLGTVIGMVNGLKFGLGLGIGSLIGGPIVDAYSFDTLFKAAGIAAVIALCVFVFLYEVVLRFCLPDKVEETHIKDKELSHSSDAMSDEMSSMIDHVTTSVQNDSKPIESLSGIPLTENETKQE